MKNFLQSMVLFLGASFMSACSVFGNSGVEVAPYSIIEQEGATEIRHYESLVLVTTYMPSGIDKGENEAFQRLFKYISGENEPKHKISMTAPVIMQNQNMGQKIEMTAPVLMDKKGKSPTMSFILPTQYDFDTTPKPLNSSVYLQQITDYTVATIRFSGLLNERNIQQNRRLLKDWLDESPYQEVGFYQTAGYNPPWTIPAFRRNEIWVQVEKE